METRQAILVPSHLAYTNNSYFVEIDIAGFVILFAFNADIRSSQCWYGRSSWSSWSWILAGNIVYENGRQSRNIFCSGYAFRDTFSLLFGTLYGKNKIIVVLNSSL